VHRHDSSDRHESTSQLLKIHNHRLVEKLQTSLATDHIALAATGRGLPRIRPTAMRPKEANSPRHPIRVAASESIPRPRLGVSERVRHVAGFPACICSCRPALSTVPAKGHGRLRCRGAHPRTESRHGMCPQLQGRRVALSRWSRLITTLRAAKGHALKGGGSQQLRTSNGQRHPITVQRHVSPRAPLFTVGRWMDASGNGHCKPTPASGVIEPCPHIVATRELQQRAR